LKSINLLIDKNIILYGPPGTGKTYYTVNYAVAVIEGKSIGQVEQEVEADGYDQVFVRYQEYKEKGQIAFTTFHQSYGYEEFIEGIKPAIMMMTMEK
jgi:5-methylcytosine-specific restriction protein B